MNSSEMLADERESRLEFELEEINGSRMIGGGGWLEGET
jgi:hypothetical protein